MRVVKVAGHGVAVEEAVKALGTYPPFTVEFYDGWCAPVMDGFTPTDMGRLIVIEALTQAQVKSLAHACEDAPWSLVPADARLVDASPDPSGGRHLYADATTLFEHFTAQDGIGPAIASKFLHLKRPAFYPLLDSYIRNLYEEQAVDCYRRSTYWQSNRPSWKSLYWAAIREDLVDLDNVKALTAVRAQLGQVEGEHHRRLSAVSEVRLLDMLGWLIARGALGASRI